MIQFIVYDGNGRRVCINQDGSVSGYIGFYQYWAGEINVQAVLR